MKTKILLSALILMIFGSLFFSSCNKYEDGPNFTLLSVNKRIVGTWNLAETKINDSIISLNDIGSYLGDFEMDSITDFDIDISQIKITAVKMKLGKDGDGYFYFAVSVMGFPFNRNEFITWKLDGDKANLVVNLQNQDENFEIMRLTNFELWLRRIDVEDGVSTTTFLKFDKEKD